MRALVRRFWTWTCTPKVQNAARLLAITAGAGAAKQLWEQTLKRLDVLEERGLSPLDDFATVGDLDRLEAKLTGRPVPQPVIDVDTVDTEEPAEATPAGAEERRPE